MPSHKEILDFIKHSKTVIKSMRSKAKELNHQADELAQSNAKLIRQMKRVVDHSPAPQSTDAPTDAVPTGASSVNQNS